MAPDANPATISSNGTAGYQVLTTSGGRGYRFDLRHNRFAQITDPDLPRPLTMAAFVDGYFVGLRGNTRQFKISSLENGTSWDGLDLGEVSTSSDNLRAMVVLQRQLWLMGSKNTTVWYNNGASNFPFAPYGGAQIEHGILAPWSAVVLDNTIYYIGQDAHGRGQVWRMNGYTPVVVSTHAVQHQLGKSARLAEAVAWAMEYEKHLWYALYVPDLPTTWLFDVSTNAWMEWGVWDPDRANWRPFPARCHTCFNGQHLVGDPSTGAIYAVDLEVAEDTLVEAA
ncbi:hypothetical protein LLG88_13700 [bacterium]|nr:hypothetical protein [bacterium]